MMSTYREHNHNKNDDNGDHRDGRKDTNGQTTAGNHDDIADGNDANANASDKRECRRSKLREVQTQTLIHAGFAGVPVGRLRMQCLCSPGW